MDSLISAAARALAAGDALQALKRVALRDDPPALALRGIAMAQLGELARSRELLRQAARGFGAHEALARARCVVAEAEVALALRDFSEPPRTLDAARAALEARGDRGNALQALLIAARRALLLGRLDTAAALLADTDLAGLPPLPAAVAALAQAELALRSLRIAEAEAALMRASDAARRAGIPALQAEVAQAHAVLQQPAARRVTGGTTETLRLAGAAALLDSGALVVDACRHGVRAGDAWLPLARRPILFTLARALAEAWPGDASRDTLIARAFRLREPDDTHRARLRVEIGRLRALMADVATITATPGGFALRPLDGRGVAVLAPPVENEQGELLALLADGAAWSTSALALALGSSQRQVQRELAELEAQGRVRAVGQTRSRRWLAPPLTGFTTILLLPAAPPSA
ncbi:helix-turn-helix domain-containing protein [Roseateles asaccharophilus]|uniref:Tetratricopeptide (TPR) repeat protein n=1 Tax=Roseateles asaccharophilus TaxID=582607 RepID=A0ABU2AEN6_9BURK|nr:helix-turn-helix domain-containing protein [Roseateles asaccharophilus]MDR7335674.1 tetratricopeptide (TPR) repeat protein [Roseateles asaccharophilus]